MRRQINQWPEWPNARDWVGIGTFALTVMLLWMMKGDPQLMRDDFFKTLTTLIVGTAFVNGVVSWAYGSTKSGTEAAESNAKAVVSAASEPQAVEVVNEPDKPIPVKGKK